MKQFLAILAAVFIGGFLALLGYDHFVVGPRVASAARAEAAGALTPRIDLERARSQAREVAAEVEASVQRSVVGARDAMDAQAKEMDRRGLVLAAAGRTTMFRVALTEFYQTNGRWPRDVDEAGLPSPVEMRGAGVDGIVLGERGVVTVKMDDTFAAGSAIVLRPAVNEASGMVDWECTVKGDPLLKQAMPRCED